MTTLADPVAPWQRFLARTGRYISTPGWYSLVLDPLLKLRPSSTPVVVERYGNLVTLQLDDYVQRRVFCWSLARAELAFTAKWCQRGDVIVDVGANAGVFTLVGARSVGPDGAVLSIEPYPPSFDTLDHNIAINGYTNVKTIRAGLGARNTSLAIGMVDWAQGSGSVSATGTVNACEVPIRTLDEVAESLPPQSIRLLKVDVEGYEREVLTGARDTLRSPRAPQIVLLEINEIALARLRSSGREVVTELERAGYRLFRRTKPRTLVPFVPLSSESVRQGLRALADTSRGPIHRLDRLMWSN
ncbi:MAG TPA: FkbM family methyltransferase, partial [Acidimicrobiia bacterium]